MYKLYDFLTKQKKVRIEGQYIYIKYSITRVTRCGVSAIIEYVTFIIIHYIFLQIEYNIHLRIHPFVIISPLFSIFQDTIFNNVNNHTSNIR